MDSRCVLGMMQHHTLKRAHMTETNQYWQDRWATGQTKFTQAQINEHLCAYFPQLNLPKDSWVFVPLCGKSLDMLWLQEQGYRVLGIELAEEACRAFFQENDLPFTESQTEHFQVFTGEHITLLAGDFFALTPEDLKDIHSVYDRASLFALPTELRQRYAALMNTCLPAHTQMLLLTFLYDETTMQGPPFCVDETEVNALYKQHWDITICLDQPNDSIPAHLVAKGLTWLHDKVYCLNKHSD